MVVSEIAVEGLDEEWMSLILEAKKLGIEMEMIRDFINQKGAN